LVYEYVQAPAAGALQSSALSDEQKVIRRKVHQTVRKASDDIGRRYTFNTAIAANMELINELYKFKDDSAQGRAIMREGLEAIVLMLSPIVPHTCHALWQALGHTTAVIDCRWPAADLAALTQDTLQLVIQVNGKLRGHISVPAGASREECERAALADENVMRYTDGKPIRKVIVVPDRLINVVV
jgi:leucyl-tRNA synthetase